MKNIKKIAVVILCAVVALVMAFVIADSAHAFNYSLFDFEWDFNRAIIKLQNGNTVKCDVKSWKDFEDGDQIQIETDDGTVYLVHSVNCTLIREG